MKRFAKTLLVFAWAAQLALFMVNGTLSADGPFFPPDPFEDDQDPPPPPPPIDNCACCEYCHSAVAQKIPIASFINSGSLPTGDVIGGTNDDAPPPPPRDEDGHCTDPTVYGPGCRSTGGVR